MTSWVSKIIWLFSTVAYVISYPAGDIPEAQKALSTNGDELHVTVVSQSAPSSQYHAQDDLGQYSYGYVSADGQSKSEVKGIDGSIAGRYGYVDANGKRVEVSYVADDNGFRATGDHLPSHDLTALPGARQLVHHQKSLEGEGSDNKEGSKKKRRKKGKKKTSGEEEQDKEEEEQEKEKSEEKEISEEEEDGKKVEGSEEVVDSVATIKQTPFPVQQPTTIYEVSNVPMTIEGQSSLGMSKPLLMYVARALPLSTSNHHHQHIQQQHPQYVFLPHITQAGSNSNHQEASAVPSATAPVAQSATITSIYPLIQPSAIIEEHHSFHTHVPALTSSHEDIVTKGQSKSRSKTNGEKSTETQSHQQQQVAVSGSHYLPKVALLPGYGYISTQ